MCVCVCVCVCMCVCVCVCVYVRVRINNYSKKLISSNSRSRGKLDRKQKHLISSLHANTVISRRRGNSPPVNVLPSPSPAQFRCCGVSGPEDFMFSAWYNATKHSLTVPATCCSLIERNPISSRVGAQRYRARYLNRRY